MRKKLIGIILFCFSLNIFAAGSYDGIYTANLNNLTVEFISIHEDQNGAVVAIVVDPNPENSWIALSGIRHDKTVVLQSIAGVDVNVTATANFSDSGNHTVVINSCTDGAFYTCKFPIGLLLNLSRIF